MTAYIVRNKVIMNAPAAKVWDALTNPEKTKKYFFNCEVFSDWQQGSSITFKGRMFLIKRIEMTGEILAIEPGKLLQYRLTNEGKTEDDPPTYSLITDELVEENGKTILSISDDVGSGDGAAERYERSVKGWDKVLKGLKQLVEEKETV